MQAGISWWEGLTDPGGEGMVVQPLRNLTLGRLGVVQSGLEWRGREYPRLVYGPDDLEPINLERLRSRTVGRKRSRARREYALGLQALRLLSQGTPLWQR